MNRGRTLKSFFAFVLAVLAATNAPAQQVKIGGEDADVFFAVTGASKNVHLVPAPPNRTSSNGLVTIPPGVTSGLKQHSAAKVYYRRNKCTQRKELVIAPPGMTAEQIQEEEKSKGQDCGGFLLLQQNVPWVSGQDLNIDYSGDAPLVTTSSATRPGSSSNSSNGASSAYVEYYLRGYGGASFINGNSPATAGFGGGVLFGIGRGVFVGPTADFQWERSSMVRSVGSMIPGSTFINTNAGFKSGIFGGQLSWNLRGFQLGIRGGATVARASITQRSGFCSVPNATNPTGGCAVTNTIMTDDTVVGPTVGGDISHAIFPHLGVLFGYDYTRLNDQTTSPTSGAKVTVFDVHSNNLYGGFVLTWERHH